MRIRLTKLEADILKHRLQSPDAICETLSPDENGGVGYHTEDTDAAIDALLRNFPGRTLETHEAEQISPAIAKAVLKDAVEGSTWIGAMLATESDQKIDQHIEAGRSLAEKVGVYVGADVEFPTA